MNLVAHYIEKINDIKDLTDDFEKHCGYRPEEPFLLVDLSCDCYGVKERKTVAFFKSSFDEAKRLGYYLS